jgi:hypothetical protein
VNNNFIVLRRRKKEDRRFDKKVGWKGGEVLKANGGQRTEEGRWEELMYDFTSLNAHLTLVLIFITSQFDI